MHRSWLISYAVMRNMMTIIHNRGTHILNNIMEKYDYCSTPTRIDSNENPIVQCDCYVHDLGRDDNYIIDCARRADEKSQKVGRRGV